MPDISTLLEKDLKKKYKKSSYRPWNYLEEMEKEEKEKTENLSSTTVLPQETIPQIQPEKIELPIEAPVISKSTVHDNPVLITPSNELPNNLQVKKEKEQSSSPLYSILRLSGHQKIIFTFVLEKCLSRGLLSSGLVTSQTLTSITNTTLSMVNTSIQRLVDKGIIFRENGKRGRGGFYCFGISESIRDAATEYKRLSAFENTDELNKKFDENTSDNYDLQKNSDYRSNETALPKELEHIDIDPLREIGFTRGHLLQLFKKGHVEFSILQDSINHYAYDLQYNNKAAEIKKSNPIGYFMGIMLKSGLYNPPENYESPKDRALRILLERKKSAKEKRDNMIKELTNIAFDEWQEKMTQEEKDKLLPEDIKKSRLSAAKVASLKAYFIEKVWPTIMPKEVDL